MDEFYKNLPERIKNVGMTQSEFAAKVGVSQSAISHYVQGKGKPRAAVDRVCRIVIEELEKAEVINEQLHSVIEERKNAAKFIGATFLKDNEFKEYIQTFIGFEIEKAVLVGYSLAKRGRQG